MKGQKPAPLMAMRLNTVLNPPTLVDHFYLKVTGTGISPVGGACQSLIPNLPEITANKVREKFLTGTACPGNDLDDIMVKVGPVCVDVYEASVWSTPTGGTQYGDATDDYPCGDNGNDCPGVIYARSVAGVLPSAYISWFQAQQACANAGKRLLTNAEWQMAAAGTPDPGTDNGTTDCNITTVTETLPEDPVNTGSRSNCVSAWGTSDMVGNVWEWAADWTQYQLSVNAGDDSTPEFGTDTIMGFNDAWPKEDRFPGALLRGGQFSLGARSGVFALSALVAPSAMQDTGLRGDFGFRCGR